MTRPARAAGRTTRTGWSTPSGAATPSWANRKEAFPRLVGRPGPFTRRGGRDQQRRQVEAGGVDDQRLRRAERLPRFKTYLFAFLLCGAPRFVVLALDLPLAAILTTAAVGGFASGFINPIIGAVIFERIPPHLVGRVSSLNMSLCWAGIPFGGIVGGVLVAGFGLSPALLVAGAAYLVATMLPAVRPEWRDVDRRSPTRSDGSRDNVVAGTTATSRD